MRHLSVRSLRRELLGEHWGMDGEPQKGQFRSGEVAWIQQNRRHFQTAEGFLFYYWPCRTLESLPIRAAEALSWGAAVASLCNQP